MSVCPASFCSELGWYARINDVPVPPQKTRIIAEMKYWRKPLDQARVKRISGEVHIVPDRCKGCGFCIRFCPKQVLEESTDMNQKGYHYPVATNGDACAGCGLCEMLCPDFAITVTSNPKEPTGV